MDLKKFNQYKDNLHQIISLLYFSYGNYERLTQIDTPEEKRVMQGVGFFHFYMLQSRYIVCIELCKVFVQSSNQKWNILKLFNKIGHPLQQDLIDILSENNERREDDPEVFANTIGSVEELREVASELGERINDLSDVIDRVKTLRDTVYAHYDNEPEVIVSNEELASLVELASDVYNDFFGSVDNITTNFSGHFVIGVDQPLQLCMERDKYNNWYWNLLEFMEQEEFEVFKKRLKRGVE